MMIEAPLPKDEPRVRQLLRACDLPEADITPEQMRHFFVLTDKGKIVGTVGVQVLGRFGLLRSLAIDPAHRGRGFASRLAEKAEQYAASLNVEMLYLLTITAEGFFSKRRYQKVPRNSAPLPLQETSEFKDVCPVSAVCMAKDLSLKAD